MIQSGFKKLATMGLQVATVTFPSPYFRTTRCSPLQSLMMSKGPNVDPNSSNTAPCPRVRAMRAQSCCPSERFSYDVHISRLEEQPISMRRFMLASGSLWSIWLITATPRFQGFVSGLYPKSFSSISVLPVPEGPMIRPMPYSLGGMSTCGMMNDVVCFPLALSSGSSGWKNLLTYRTCSSSMTCDLRKRSLL